MRSSYKSAVSWKDSYKFALIMRSSILQDGGVQDILLKIVVIREVFPQVGCVPNGLLLVHELLLHVLQQVGGVSEVLLQVGSVQEGLLQVGIVHEVLL